MKKIATLLCLALLAVPAFGQLVINEVLYDPSNNALDGDANGDGVYSQEDDTFIEIYNSSSTNFDISGYEIWDDTTSGNLKLIFPPNTLIPPNGVIVIFGGGPLVGNFGGAVTLTNDTSSNGLNFNNSGEVIVIRDDQGQTVLTFDSDALSNNPNESYTRNPDITGAFEQHGDNTAVLFSPGTKIDGTPFDTAFVVSEITVSGMNGDSTITSAGGALQMMANIYPSYAADTTVTWSVPAGNGVATINSSGLLTAVADGSVYVTATANDGTMVSDSIEITISNQSIGLQEVQDQFALQLYPNPVKDILHLSSAVTLDQVELFNLQGQKVQSTSEVKALDLSDLPAGNYILKARHADQINVQIITKQ